MTTPSMYHTRRSCLSLGVVPQEVKVNQLQSVLGGAPSTCCAAASALKLMASVLVEDNAKSAMPDRASATKFAIPLTCQMSVVNCEM